MAWLASSDLLCFEGTPCRSGADQPCRGGLRRCHSAAIHRRPLANPTKRLAVSCCSQGQSTGHSGIRYVRRQGQPTITQLKKDLLEAVHKEHYSTAAQIRDLISQLELANPLHQLQQRLSQAVAENRFEVSAVADLSRNLRVGHAERLAGFISYLTGTSSEPVVCWSLTVLLLLMSFKTHSGPFRSTGYAGRSRFEGRNYCRNPCSTLHRK